jgi:hypothetical protein
MNGPHVFIFAAVILLVAGIVLISTSLFDPTHTQTPTVRTSQASLTEQHRSEIKTSFSDSSSIGTASGRTSTIASSSRVTLQDHIDKMATASDGNPNPRLSCTPGIVEARSYLVSELTRMGLTPLGNTEQTQFTYTLPGSDNPECPGLSFYFYFYFYLLIIIIIIIIIIIFCFWEGVKTNQT